MAVKGASPVTFISEHTQAGKQYQIPLSRLTFDDTGTIDSSDWQTDNGINGNDKDLLSKLLQSLASQGFLTKPST